MNCCAIHGRVSRLANPSTTFAKVLFAALHFALEFVRELQLVFEQVFQPVTQFFLLFRGKQTNIGFNLFKRFHCHITIPQCAVFVKRVMLDARAGQPMIGPVTGSQTRIIQGLILLLGLCAFAIILAFHNITEGDLWAQLAIGEWYWEHGYLLRHDIFAFTPTLPNWIAHEWGTGVVFYAVLKSFGPQGLMALKILTASGALAFALIIGRKQGCNLNLLLLLAIPCAACLLPGYIPVIRSHVFTFFFFGATLLCLEELRKGQRWAAFALPVIMWLWGNLHGGLMAGLAIVFVYAAAAVVIRKDATLMIGVAVACVAVTFINPYGVEFWKYLIPALRHPRAQIPEWHPLPVFAWDDFWGFRVLFVLTVIAIALGWRKTSNKNYLGLAVLALTAAMGWHVRRHGPFFGVAALAFAGPYYASALGERVSHTWTVAIAYVCIAFYVALEILPGASLQPLAPVGEVPVRETDILSLAHAKGNLASPFAWGSYLSWRLFPKIKISMDGRYETTYPESSFNMNSDFFEHEGDWLKLIRSYKVDYVILNLVRDRLRPEDLIAQGYVLIWKQDDVSALLCLPEHAALLKEAAANLPPTTIDPLDLKAHAIERRE